jgi:DNA-binding NtrC family response regulator
MAATILIIDDDYAVRVSLKLLLEAAGYQIFLSENPESALINLAQHSPNLILMDMNYSRETSGAEGLDLLKRIKKIHPELPIILMTAWASIPLAVEGIKQGATDFISKPWQNEQLLRAIRTAIHLSVQLPQLNRQELDQHYDFCNIIGHSPALLKVLQTVARVSQTDAPVLLIGESGSGKERIAEAIHQNSQRRSKTLVKVNLAAIPPTLFESELFGHVKGAFTDAHSDRPGRFAQANLGTIFLDEIGDLPLNNQVKLLRVLQEGSYHVLGSDQDHSVDTRVISATNRDIFKLLDNNQFREDLFYRINLITIEIPPLRERVEDIPQLLQFFIKNLQIQYQLSDIQVSRAGLNFLMNQSWPGNIREFKNVIERTVLMTRKVVLDVEDFQDNLSQKTRLPGEILTAPAGTMTIEEMEKMMIKKALIKQNYNLSQVARALGLSRASLYRRLEKYKLTNETKD